MNKSILKIHKYIIFDLDGTLIDSRNSIRVSVDFVVDKFKLKKLNNDEFDEFLSYSPIYASFEKVFKIQTTEALRYSDEYMKYYKEAGFKNTVKYDGVELLLKTLKNNNYKISIATCKNELNAKKVISHLGLNEYFDDISGMDSEHKTKNEVLKKCLERLKVNSDKCIFVGDTLADAQATNELEIDFIGVTYGFGFKSFDDMIEFQPVFCADSVSELMRYFKNKE